MPLLNQRFREMKGGASLAQHDRKQILRDEKQLLHLFSVGATIGRPLPVIKNKTFFSRLVIRTKHYAHHTRTVIPVRNATPLSFRAKPRNLVETNSFFFPAAGCYCCLGSVPRGLNSAAAQSPLPRDVSTRFACST